MKTIIDFLPVVAFFLAYFLPGGDIYRATIVLMITMPVQVLAGYLLTGGVTKIHLVSLVLVLILGAATLVLKNDMFIKWKPTVIDWLFAAVFLGSQLVTGKPLIQRAAGEALQLEDRIWRQMNLAWVVFFFVLGVLNLVVVYNFSEAIWVNFKLFGTLALTLAFMLAQGFWVQRHLPSQEGKDS